MSKGGGAAWLGGIGAAFSDRNFRRYSVGSAASWLSFFTQVVTISWLTWELTDSTVWLAAMALLGIVPNVVLMPLTGVLADRHDRHRIMTVASFLMMLQGVALALLQIAGLLNIWALAAMALYQGVLISFMVPAMYGTLPRFVGREVLSSAIAVSSSYMQLAVFIGPALAGWIIAHYGVLPAFIANAVGYAMLLGAFLSLKTPSDYEKPPPSKGPILRDIWEGFVYIAGRRTILPLLLLGVSVDIVAIGFHHVAPAYADDVLKMGVLGLSTILTARGLGAFAAALWLAHGGAGAIRYRRILWASLIAILSLAALVMTENIYIAAPLACLMGFALEIRETGTMSFVQLSIDEAQRGRVLGTWFMMVQISAGIGAFLIGNLAVGFGLRLPVLAGCGLVVIVWTALYLRTRHLPDPMEPAM